VQSIYKRIRNTSNIHW